MWALHRVFIALLCVHSGPDQGLDQAPHPPQCSPMQEGTAAPNQGWWVEITGSLPPGGCGLLEDQILFFTHVPGWGPWLD